MTFTAVSYGTYVPNAIDRGTALQFSENQGATVCSFGKFYLYMSQRRKEALDECSCFQILELALVSD